MIGYKLSKRKSSINSALSNKTRINVFIKILQKLKRFLYSLYCFAIFITGLIPSFLLRTFIYRHIFLMKIGKNTKIRGFVEIIFPWNIEIGDNTLIGKNCILDGRKGLKIGHNVNISDAVAIYTEQHDINDRKFLCNDKGGSVTIGDKVWLCFRSVILPKINIEEGCVIATGAIVTKDCEGYSLYVGIPAKKVKERNLEIDYNLDLAWTYFY